MTLAVTIAKIVWLSYILINFQINIAGPLSLFCDNQYKIHKMKNSIFHEKTKHIRENCYFIRTHFAQALLNQPMLRPVTKRLIYLPRI